MEKNAELDSEQEFLATHSAYRNIADKQATKQLARTLNQASLISDTLTRGTFYKLVILGFLEPHSG